MEKRYSNPSSDGAHFEDLFDRYTLSQNGPIPRVAHFIYTESKDYSWPEWAAIRAAVVNLGVSKVKIWLPEEAEPTGPIWRSVLEMPEVTVNWITLPKSVYDHDILDPRYQSDVVRLKILYEEGGIFLENDLVALRSSDDVLDDPKTRSTVMAKRGNPESVPNWLIMSKPGSPFLKTWMQEYEGASDEQSWQQLATGTPWDLAKNNDPDVTVLSADTWFHPITTEPDLDSSLTKMWFGKSWDNIDKSYGTHVWHWVGSLKSSITPEAVRSIDTPLFCRLRKLFDNLEGDGYYSIPSDKNLNCSIIQIGDLSQKDLGLFSDYRVTLHDTDIKWVDSSGFNNHGWAPSGTPVAHDGSGVFRNITTGSYAVLPVPAGWDSRMWTARVGFRIDPRMLTPGSEAGLFKIRFEGDGEILVRMSGKRKPSQVVFQVDWSEGAKFAEEAKQYDQQRDIIWVPVSGLRNLQEDLHELAITFDRRDYGGVQIFIDGKEIGSKRLPLIDSFKAGQDIWLNARNWDELDTGFRGLLSRFTMYADALSPEDIANPISYTTAAHTASGLYVNVAHVKETSGSKFLVGVFFMFLLLYLLLQRKPLIRDMPWFIREAVRKLWRIGEALAKA